MTSLMAGIAGDRATDPEAQAAVTDFLDYTEYLPSDLVRSLTLIRGLDDAYLSSADAIHDLAKQYGRLPSLEPAVRPDAQSLRLQMAAHLNQALSSRETAYAEACRLFDMAERHQNRLKSIIAKLDAIPKPPSRNPSPVPAAAAAAAAATDHRHRSPQKVSRSGRKLQTGAGTGTGIGSPAARLTLNPPRGNTVAAALLGRPRARRITVPGEVMPPYDPDEAIASTEVSDWDSPPPPPPSSASPPPRPRPTLKLKQPKAPPAAALPPQQQQHQHPKEGAEGGGREKPARAPREHVAYRKPTPPPEDAELGGKYRPWTHLTEYEMYRLRKKMKKNHEWEPSQVMIRRELESRGRGWDNYYKAKAEAEKNGTPFIFVDSNALPKSERQQQATQLEQSKASQTQASPVAAAAATTTTTTTIGAETAKAKAAASKKTELKKDKKVDPARDRAAAAAQEAELAARRLGDIGSAFKNLFSPISSALANLNRSTTSPAVISPTAAAAAALSASTVTPGAAATPSTSQQKTAAKKRKLEELGVSASPSAEPEGQRKKLRTPSAAGAAAVTPARISQPASSEPLRRSTSASAGTGTGTIKIPLKLKVTGPSTSSSSAAASSSSSSSSTHSRTTTPVPAAAAAAAERSRAGSAAAAPNTATSSVVTLKTEEPASPRPLPSLPLPRPSKSPEPTSKTDAEVAMGGLTDADGAAADEQAVLPAATSPSPAPVPVAAALSATGPPTRRTSARTTPGIPAFSSSSTRRPTPVAGGPPEDGSPPAAAATTTAAGRRPKREVPGTVMQTSQDGGAAVSVSRRKTKPVKTKARAVAGGGNPHAGPPEVRVDADGHREVIDPDEERYCVCGDVSYGEMICCELDEKCANGQWFHMDCVGLVERPGRTVKWYCPTDRKKYRRGEASNGLVGRGIK